MYNKENGACTYAYGKRLRAREVVTCNKKPESEKITERYLKARVESMGGKCVKIANNGSAGMPDRLCIFPGGVVAFIELKSEGKKPRPLQMAWLRWMESIGHIAEWCDTKARVDEVLGMVSDYIEKP